MDRREIKKLWTEFGGRFHGPNVEHAIIEEQAFYRFVDRLLDVARRSEAKKCAKIAQSVREQAAAGSGFACGAFTVQEHILARASVLEKD